MRQSAFGAWIIIIALLSLRRVRSLSASSHCFLSLILISQLMSLFSSVEKLWLVSILSYLVILIFISQSEKNVYFWWRYYCNWSNSCLSPWRYSLSLVRFQYLQQWTLLNIIVTVIIAAVLLIICISRNISTLVFVNKVLVLFSPLPDSNQYSILCRCGSYTDN